MTITGGGIVSMTVGTSIMIRIQVRYLLLTIRIYLEKWGDDMIINLLIKLFRFLESACRTVKNGLYLLKK